MNVKPGFIYDTRKGKDRRKTFRDRRKENQFWENYPNGNLAWLNIITTILLVIAFIGCVYWLGR